MSHRELSVPPCKDSPVVRQALRPQLTDLCSESVENPETSATSQGQRKEMLQCLTEKRNAHQQGPTTNVLSPASCDHVPLYIGNSGQRHSSAGAALTHTNLKREERKASKSYKDLVKGKRLTKRHRDKLIVIVMIALYFFRVLS